ncbi:MAG: hypothetical protein Q8M16_05790 [Pirellulaceae bacterium]|nr:hypothetical protein [Pirellulaceae bacterium]
MTNQEVLERFKSLRRSFDEIRHEVYGNCYIKGTIAEQSLLNVDEKQSAMFRYWSREGRFFRFDVFDDDNQLKRSLIVRPEGYVLTVSKDGKSVVEELGDNQDGMLLLVNAYGAFNDPTETTYQSGLELIFMAVGFSHEIIDSKLSFENTKFVLDEKVRRFVAQLLNGDLVIEFEKAGEIVNVVFRDQEPNVLRSFSVQKDGKETGKKLEYDAKLGSNVIPVRSQAKLATKTRTTIIEEVEVSPQPMALFSLEEHGFGTSWVWFRRLAFLCVGLMLFGAYLIYRKRMKK